MNYYFTYLVDRYKKIISKRQIVILQFLIIISYFDVYYLHKDNNYFVNQETQKLRPAYGWKSLEILPENQ